MPEATPDPNLPVSHEVDGRILTGVGVTPEALAETMERHTADEPEDAAPEASTAPAAPAQPNEPKRSRGQRRFDELTREREDARREAETVKRELAELKAKQAAPAPVREPERPAAAAPVEPTPAFSFLTFEAWAAQNPAAANEPNAWDLWNAAHVDARTDWKLKTGQYVSKADLDAQIRSRIEADWASRQAAQDAEQRHARGRAAYPDFDAVLQQPHMLTPWPPEKLEAMRSLGSAEHLQYALGKNPDLAERLRAEPNMVKFGMELAQLIPSLRVAPPASTPAGSPVVPAPYQPVGASSKTTPVPASELPKRFGSDFDKSGYREKRAAERGVRR